MYRRRYISATSASEKINIDNYLTIEALGDGLTVTFTKECQYCIDGNGNWITLSANGTTPSINMGQTISFKATASPNSSAGVGTFSVNKSFGLKGNCMSMLFGDDAESNKSLSGKNYAFKNLFKNCTTLSAVSKNFLPATTLGTYCYQYMFQGCTLLRTAPELPAMSLATNCYDYMFDGCTLLRTAPELPATTLSSYCYRYMFRGCTSLTSVPTTLPATTLTTYCYAYMFQNCTALTAAPELPATTLNTYCYYYMFDGCNKLTAAPELPATTMKGHCYRGMFRNCSLLNTAPILPAKTMVTYCYYGMFYGCSSLAKAPELPATSLNTYCYAYMFYGCSSLTKAPELPATSLSTSCYQYMFQNCSKLNYIKMLATTTISSSTSYTTNWVSGVAATGTFIKNPSATWNLVGASGVPTGWTTQMSSFLKSNYLTIEALENGTTVSFSNGCYYTTDDTGVWNTYNNGTSLSINAGQTISFKDAYILSNNNDSGIGCFFVNKSFNLTGNCMSMLFGDNAITNKSLSGKNNIFQALFANCTTLKSVSENFLPATTLADYCYYDMFYGCTSLTSTPELPATTLAPSCYDEMFMRCTSLTSAPKLSATKLADNCYESMFRGCTSLTTAPALPATTLADYCYYDMFFECAALTSAPKLPATKLAEGCYMEMFYGCTSLTSAPTLPATTLAMYCYEGMFRKCTSLTSAPTLPATTLAMYCYSDMFEGCESLTSAPELPATTLFEGCYRYMFSDCQSLTSAGAISATTLAHICCEAMFQDCYSLVSAPELPATTLAEDCYADMFSGCESLTSAPVLPATTLVDNCYIRMFSGCSELSYIKMLAIDISAPDCLMNWVDGVNDHGLFVKNKDATWDDVEYYNGVVYNYRVPEGWNKETVLDISNYLTIEILEDNTLVGGRPFGSYHQTWYYMVNGHIDEEYYIDDVNNQSYPDNMNTKHTNKEWIYLGANSPLKYEFNAGDKICFKACYPSHMSYGVPTYRNPGCCQAIDVYGYNYYDDGDYDRIKKPFNVTGNCMSMCIEESTYGQNTIGVYKNLEDCPYALCRLFSECDGLQSVPKNFLPATTLANNCYDKMFEGCTSLKAAPELPATTLADWCYLDMFNGCTSLTSTPSLPATTLAEGCYSKMFMDCISLVNTSRLPAITLTDYCYESMFCGCTSLKTAPTLPATTLASECYHQMFRDCIILNYIKMMATSDCENGDSFIDWVMNVAETGKFMKHYNSNFLPVGVDGIPNGWTVTTSYNTPSISKSNSNVNVTFNFNGGVYTPLSTDNILHITSSDLLSMQPNCNIVVNIRYLNTSTNRENSKLNVKWNMEKKLGDILENLYSNKNNLNSLVQDVAIIITNTFEPEDDGYYGYSGGDVEATGEE